ncbi:hexokinase [Colletotrichum graminicola]|uniref:Phosphotransferase n=1 Tax=Colletotrichum graminicola (strain M1.001 / M2 / FGSC 10212) TaxID=645133 RepID=E3QH95_COLGM|nr:hexokinase [Colletotrichum graminicola M1.001]EFQ30257.1 hexokinase [Colletotrichum graminicola M1.001]WDK09068.1 hexokinase [Colletotrichum graminicola]
MQQYPPAMTTFPKAFLAAVVKQLLRGKSLIQALLAFWITPYSGSGKQARPTVECPKSATTTTSSSRDVEEFLKEAEDLLLGPLLDNGLLALSNALKAQFRDKLQTSMACMLPSYNHQLPDGYEAGQYLAVDVGGSTLRVALVELRGRDAKGSEGEVVRMSSLKIDSDIRNLEGMAFFDWMAERIWEMVSQDGHDPSQPMPMALAWSFPIEQTSLKGGRIHSMGKGFLAAEGLMGKDLGEVIESACSARGMNAQLRVILNDGGATLLSQAYVHPATRFGLILGTGVNIAAYLPVSLIGRPKFGDRPREWWDEARDVIVNTELGMFGQDVLSVTRWDRLLKQGHPRPELQPLEMMVSGYYLGEVVRFALIEAIETTGLFGGVVPKSLEEPYSLKSETISAVEGDASPMLTSSIDLFVSLYPSSHTPTSSDMSALRSLASFVSRRSAAIIAACLHAVWSLRLEALSEEPEEEASDRLAEESSLVRTMVAYNGSVIECYPGYLAMCQDYVDALINREDRSIDLVLAKESSLLGAGVALAMACDASE